MLQEVQRHTAEFPAVGELFLNGRHLINRIYRWCATAEGAGAIYTVADLSPLTLRGGAGLQWYYNEWSIRVAHQSGLVDPEQLKLIPPDAVAEVGRP